MSGLCARMPDMQSAMLVATNAKILRTGFVERGVDTCLSHPVCEKVDTSSSTKKFQEHALRS